MAPHRRTNSTNNKEHSNQVQRTGNQPPTQLKLEKQAQEATSIEKSKENPKTKTYLKQKKPDKTPKNNLSKTKNKQPESTKLTKNFKHTEKPKAEQSTQEAQTALTQCISSHN